MADTLEGLCSTRAERSGVDGALTAVCTEAEEVRTAEQGMVDLMDEAGYQ